MFRKLDPKARMVLVLALAGSLWLVPAHRRRAFSSGTSGPVVKKLDVKLLPQLRDLWCWAASSQMVMQYKDRNGTGDVSQCRQAQFPLAQIENVDVGNLSVECCSNSPDATQCNNTSWPIFDKLNFSAKSTETDPEPALSFSKIVSEIDADRPVLFAVQWDAGGGHMGVIYGYEVDAHQTQILHVYDPLLVPVPGSTDPELKRGGRIFSLPYARFKDYSVDADNPYPEWWFKFKHWRDYYEIKTNAP